LFTVALSAGPARFYVSPNGSDANPGTKRKPFVTLETARDAVRQLKQKSGVPKGGVSVWVRGGTYVRERSFELSAADSGTPGSPVIYRGYQRKQRVCSAAGSYETSSRSRMPRHSSDSPRRLAHACWWPISALKGLRTSVSCVPVASVGASPPPISSCLSTVNR